MDCEQLKRSIVPVIQMLDRKVRAYRGESPYGIRYIGPIDSLSYAQLEKLRDELVEEYNGYRQVRVLKTTNN
jgi:hypothetical protein